MHAIRIKPRYFFSKYLGRLCVRDHWYALFTQYPLQVTTAFPPTATVPEFVEKESFQHIFPLTSVVMKYEPHLVALELPENNTRDNFAVSLHELP